MSGAAEVRELRAAVRHWRRGRADTRIVDAISDAYIAVFSTVMLGSMSISAVIDLRATSGQACTSHGCLEARGLLPWLVALSAVLVVLVMARLFGPVFVSPAVSSWLLSSPIDRSALLRPRLVGTLVAAAIGAAAVAGIAAALGGFGVSASLALTASAALAAMIVTGLAARSQTRDGIGARVLTAIVGFVVWAGLMVLAVRRGPITSPATFSTAWLVGLVAGLALALVLVVRTIRELTLMRRKHLTPGGELAPGLSGALAGLDFALVFDVLLARRWRSHPPVVSRRGGPAGPMGLVWLDLVRLTRGRTTLVLLAAAAVLPYVAEAAGGGDVVVLIAASSGFVSSLGLFAALRVVTRTPGLVRIFPFSSAVTRMATLVVPGTVVIVFALTAIPALHGATRQPWADAIDVGVAVGFSSVVACVRWITGRPPDYSRPLVTSPMGAVPTNLYGSAVRGFDILLVTCAPMLFSPDHVGATISLALSAAVLAYLVGRK